MPKTRVDFDISAFIAGLDIASNRIKTASQSSILRLAYDIRNKARFHCPIDTGKLSSSITVFTPKFSPAGRIYSVQVGTKVSYGPFVEFGTRPHIIRIKNKKTLANRKTGQIFGPVVHHPGTTPRPFMRSAIIESAISWKPGIKI